MPSSRGAPARDLGAAVLAKVRAAMEERSLDVLLAMAPESIVYVAGVVPPSLRTVRSRLACCVVPAEGPTEMVVVALEKGVVEPSSRLDSVTAYREFEQDAVLVAAASLQERGLANSTIGIEATYLPKADFDRLEETLPRAKFVAADDLLSEVRSIKSPEELEAIELVGRAAQRIGEECLETVSAGDSEAVLGRCISERYAQAGGQLTMLVVGAGIRSALANAAPTERVMQPGDTVRIDVIGTRDNYCSDVARTAVVGEPSAEQQRLYGTLERVHERILERLRPGVRTSDIYALYKKAMEDAGLPFYHFVGHGLGVTLHEDPFIRDGHPVTLAANMVLCIEPMTLIEGRHGMQIEDEIVITADGCRPITAANGLLSIGA
jgi:Xaa-Pro dipeptidase